MKVESSSFSSIRGKIQEKSLRHQIFSLYIFWLICKKTSIILLLKGDKGWKKYSICKFFFFHSNHQQISFSHMSEVSMALRLGTFVCSSKSPSTGWSRVNFAKRNTTSGSEINVQGTKILGVLFIKINFMYSCEWLKSGLKSFLTNCTLRI